ncbi:MAG: hypothetical protein ACM3O4_00285 [Ignavibacteriales bacterium]
MKNIIYIVVLIFVFLFYFIYTQFTAVLIIEDEGYIISNDKLTENLYNDDLDIKQSSIKPSKVYSNDTLYAQHGKFYVGDNKKQYINEDYPIFTNKNLALVNLSSKTKLIDENFEVYAGYPNFTLTSGALYNKDDKTRADENNYIFLELPNSLLVNSKPILIKTQFNKTEIVMNSILNINEDNIRFYSPDNDNFKYFSIEDIDKSSIFIIDNKEYTYNDILIKLGKIDPPRQPIPPTDEKDPSVDDDNKNDNGPIDKPVIPYQKPTVSCENFTANVYSIFSNLKIVDPSRAINKAVSFTVKQNGKIYLRKSFNSSGNFQIIGLSPNTEFEITGTFNYINDKDQEIQETFIQQTITTKGIEELDTIKLAFTLGSIYSNKIELNDLRIESNLDSEVIKGVKKGVIVINNETYKISSNNLYSLLNGNAITYTSPDTLVSNSTINFSIFLSDNYGNDLKVINNTGKTMTSKAIPKTNIKVVKNDIVEVELNANLENKDNVSINNYRYVVYSNNNVVVDEGLMPSSGTIKLTKLDPNEVYTIYTYADFDIDDGKGTQRDQMIGDAKFTSASITTLGYFRLNINMLSITESNAKMNLKINTESTDSRLVSLLDGLNIIITKKQNNEEFVVYNKQVPIEGINELKLGNSIDISIDDLVSSTEYYIDIQSIVKQGNSSSTLKTLNNLKSFQTMKRKAQVLIRNMFSTQNLIDFDVKVVDQDNAILSNKVSIEVRDEKDRIIKVNDININDDYVRVEYTKLNKLTNYKFKYIVGEYNEGHTNATFYSNYPIEEYTIYTEEGIIGNIGLISLLEKTNTSPLLYNTELIINLNDTRNEIITKDYYINIYKDNELVETNRYEMGDTSIVTDAIKQYVLERNSEYKFELLVKIRDRFYVINSTAFTTEKEIRSIRTTTEFFAMDSNKKYIVLNDLDFTRLNRNYNGTFNGEIDFQGHTVKLNVQNRPSYLFHTLSSTALIQNLNLEISLDNPVERSYWYGFNYYSYGTIRNLKVTIVNATAVPNIIYDTISYVNYGTVENFVINSKVPIHGSYFFSTGVLHNYGTMKNGYVYGEPINATYPNGTTGNKRVGPIAAYTGVNSNIENVFSLLTVNTASGLERDKQVGSIIGESNRGILQNTYSVGSGQGVDLNLDPNVGVVSNTINVRNLFYASNDIFNANYSQKISSLAIHDVDFQNNVLNNENKFIIDELVSKGFYPQLDWPDCMPSQDLIPLITVEDSDLIDITSLEVIEPKVDSAKVMFNVHNPAGERITRIDIKDVSVEILSQTYANGKSKVIANITNPIKYVSKYYVMAINSVGAYNIPYTRKYAANERILYFDLYRNISSINDWNLIKSSPSENYQLTTDLDFRDAINFSIGNFSGKLNGNGYTIKNIEISSGNGLFTTLSGEIKNLYVNNYRKTNAASYGGLIYNTANNPIIDNVHMKNVYINATSYIGGLVGYSGSGIIIRNSSVTNFNNITGAELNDVRIGSLVGYLSSGYIENCFAQDVNISILDSVSTFGVGGLVGQLSGGVIENSYAIGKISTNSVYTGGIVGWSSGSLYNVYSKVDINSELDFIGGIIGNSNNNITSRTLSLGNLYSSYLTSNMHRTVGNIQPNQYNYAYSEQTINGFTSTSVFGETLLSKEDLLIKNTYINVIKLGDFFNYDSIEQDGSLPKLYNTTGDKLLPNQVNNYIEEVNFPVINVNVVQRINDATVLVSFKNPENKNITNIEFDYFNIVQTNKNLTVNGITTIEVVVEPIKYFDTYKLNKIIYEENGESKLLRKAIIIPLQFYKNIEKFEDWQLISKDDLENYRLVADIDFSGKININTNVSIGRLEGTDGGHTLKNLTLNFKGSYNSLIKKLSTSLKNVNFENIQINNTATSGSYTSIIRMSNADIDRVNFSNITINAPNMSYVAPIIFGRGYNTTNITLQNITATGLDFTSGFVSRSLYDNNFNNITANYIKVVGRDYTGGVLAYKEYYDRTTFNNFTLSNMDVSGRTYVGGLAGVGSASYSSISDSTISGNNYVGGMSGNSYFYRLDEISVTNCHVKGTATDIGGAFGYSYYVYNGYVTGTLVEGLSTASENVGGMVGRAITGYALYNSGVINSTVTSNGRNTGGFIGYQNSSIYYSFIYNTTVRGVNNVGGITGYIISGNIGYNSTNANVEATGINAGAIIGYVDNIFTTGATNVSRIYSTIVERSNVKAQSNAGGLIGNTGAPLYSGHFFGNLVVANIIATNQYGLTSPTVGNDRAYSNLITNLRVYDNTTINGTPVKDVPNNGLTSTNLVDFNKLKLQTTYTSIGLSTTYWNYPDLATGNFPRIKSGSTVIVPNQVLISLPSDINPLMSQVVASANILPKFDVYSTGVDKINLEFNDIQEYTKFTIEVDNKIVEQQPINSRIYTFDYDYVTDFTIRVSDGINETIKKITPDIIKKEASVFGDNYYYIKNDRIISNDTNISGIFVNIHLDKALNVDGDIYDLTLKQLTDNNIKGITLSNTITPLFEFEHENSIIKTYNNFSTIEKFGNIAINENQIFIKDGKLELIDSRLPSIKASVIIDNYGNKSYQTVLGNDGIIYNLKEKINFPNDFENKNIKYMTHNFSNNNGTIVVVYDNGSFYGFDYRTGQRIFIDKVKPDMTLIDYFKTKLSISKSVIDKDIYNSFVESKELEKKLIANPIDKVLSGKIDKNEKPNSTNENELIEEKKYVVAYDPAKQEFVIYDEESFISIEKEKSVSETAKIYSNTNLIDFYIGNSKGKKIFKFVNGLTIFGIIILSIIISLIYYLKNIKFLNKFNN